MTPDRDLFSHARRALDFDSVLALVAAGCVTAGARRAIEALAPSTDETAIEVANGRFAEYREWRGRSGDLEVADTAYRDPIERPDRPGDPLDALGLLALATGERAARALSRQLATADPYPSLVALRGRLDPQVDLVDRVERSLEPDGRVRDQASPALAGARRAVRRDRSELRSRCEKIAAGFGEESFSTLSGERYVVLVPRARFRRREGVVHGTSQTGESVYFEPLDVVERNNRLETHLAGERAEEARVLRELNEMVRAAEASIVENANVIEEVDAIRSVDAFARAFDCRTCEVSREGDVRLVSARHPLLVRVLAGGREVVPLDISMDRDARVMVITGPNAGGKTVAIKTVGTASLLFQCGLPVPCGQGSRLPLFESIDVDVGDEQSLEDSLSTFTSHLRHLDTMCRVGGARALCLIDEIGYGTDPDEGAAIAVAALEHLRRRGATVVATTHYGRIKVFALQAEGIVNASMAFEAESGRPLYRLLQGVAGQSRGIDTARRVGLLPAVVDAAEAHLGRDTFRLESLLSELQETHVSLRKEREVLERRSERLDHLSERYAEKLAEFDIARGTATARAAGQAEELLRATRRQIESMVREIRESQARRETLCKTRRRLDDLLEQSAVRRRAAPPDPGALKAVSPGQRVSASPSGRPAGVVLEVDKETATVEINGKRIRIQVKNLYPTPIEETGQPNGVAYDGHVEPLSSTSVDVRGLDREQALEKVHRFIDRAVLSGVTRIIVIHGVGGGILAGAVAGMLRADPRVESSRSGGIGEGGVGATVVTLR